MKKNKEDGGRALGFWEEKKREKIKGAVDRRGVVTNK